MKKLVKKILYMVENMPFIIHLAFGTKHFGINNKLWSNDSSIFSVPLYKGLFQFPSRIRMMKKRAFIGFLPYDEAKNLFPEYAKNYNKDK